MHGGEITGIPTSRLKKGKNKLSIHSYKRHGSLCEPEKNKNKSLYLSVNVFSTAVLIQGTENSETNIINQTETC